MARKKHCKYFIRPSSVQPHFCLFKYLERLCKLRRAVRFQRAPSHRETAADDCGVAGVKPPVGTRRGRSCKPGDSWLGQGLWQPGDQRSGKRFRGVTAVGSLLFPIARFLSSFPQKCPAWSVLD